MKDIIITGSDLLREFIVWVLCLAAAIGVNIYAIIIHDGFWSELYTQFHVVLAVSVVLYLLLVVIRGIVLGIRTLLKNNFNKE